MKNENSTTTTTTTTTTALNPLRIPAYITGQGLRLEQHSFLADSEGGTDRAVWKISGKLIRIGFDEENDVETETKLVSWSGTVLPGEIEQAEEADAISEEYEYLYSTMAPRIGRGGDRDFAEGLKTSTGGEPMEAGPQCYDVLLLDDLDFADAAFAKDDSLDRGIEAFLKTYDYGLGASVPGTLSNLVTVVFLKNDDRITDAFQKEGWNIIEKTSGGYWVACRIFESLV